jgi:hypothetical protein
MKTTMFMLVTGVFLLTTSVLIETPFDTGNQLLLAALGMLAILFACISVFGRDMWRD